MLKEIGIRSAYFNNQLISTICMYMYVKIHVDLSTVHLSVQVHMFVYSDMDFACLNFPQLCPSAAILAFQTLFRFDVNTGRPLQVQGLQISHIIIYKRQGVMNW